MPVLTGRRAISKIQAALDEHEADAALLTALPDIRWACGFTGSNGVLIVFRDEALFLSDGRYEVQANEEVEGAEIHIPGYKIFEYIEDESLLERADRVAFQSDHVSVATLQSWKERFGHVAWVPVASMMDRQVARKSAEQVEKMRRAQRTTEAVFEHILGVIEPDVTEREVAAEVVYQHMKRGADKVSFDPIVASGPRGALPHARSTDKEIRRGDMIVLDMGGVQDGYVSDMTRTVAVGDPGEEARAVYDLVLEAQEAALEAARAGMPADELDAVARDIIEQAGHEEHFGHGLGHGIGLQIKEWPRVSYHVDYELPARASVTIEPGVYLPDRFGVRIEDTIVLREDGCDNLTQAPKGELITL